MVTTGAAEMVTTGGVTPGGVTPGQGAQPGGDSLFAQLLGGVVGDATTTSAEASPAKRGNGKPASVDTAVAPTVDVLALCGLPVAGPTPAATPTSEVVVPKSEQQTGDAVTVPTDAALQALTNTDTAARSAASPMQAAQTPEPSTDIASSESTLLAGDSRAARMADVRWLSSGARDFKADMPASPAHIDGAAIEIDAPVASATTQPEPVLLRASDNVAAQMNAQSVSPGGQNADEQRAAPIQQTKLLEGANELAIKPDSIPGPVLSPEQQPAFQKLMSQVTPLMNMISGQSRDTGDTAMDQSPRDVAVTDVQNPVGALHAAGLQPAGTQLARDVSVMDVSPRHHLHASVGSQQWATELGDKLTMMAARDTRSATLYMTPADMGPVQVRIELDQNQASVWFTAENPETRSALEQSLPKLREMFNAQGMSLTDAGVFGDRSRQQQPENNFTASRFSGFQYEDSEALADTAAVRTISLGLLDAYA